MLDDSVEVSTLMHSLKKLINQLDTGAVIKKSDGWLFLILSCACTARHPVIV